MLRLYDEGRARERAVVAGVVEMQMAVHDDRHVIGLHANGGETRHDRVIAFHHHLEPTLRTERGVGTVDVHGMKTGVEDDVTLTRAQQRRPHRCDDTFLARGAFQPRLECRAHDVDGARAEQDELDHQCLPCARAWPRPRTMSQRLTGKVTTNATAKPTARLAQNSALPSPASIAPGTSSTTRLSTASITTIEIVSAASVIRSASATAMPERNRGTNVNE